MTWIEALILGIVQGLTEFLPISSSGHLEIGSALLGIKSDGGLLFAVTVHLATALATIFVFRKDIHVIIFDLLKFRWNDSSRLVCMIIISIIPIAIIVVLFKDQIPLLFAGQVKLVGIMLLITGILLGITHFKKSGILAIGYGSALFMGIAQVIAIFPGISRSGITIATGLFLGVEKSQVVRFSFLMVLIPILGAGLLGLMEYAQDPTLHPLSISSMVIGFIAAFVSGVVACKWMITVVMKGMQIYFATYCLTVGVVTIILA